MEKRNKKTREDYREPSPVENPKEAYERAAGSAHWIGKQETTTLPVKRAEKLFIGLLLTILLCLGLLLIGWALLVGG